MSHARRRRIWSGGWIRDISSFTRPNGAVEIWCMLAKALACCLRRLAASGERSKADCGKPISGRRDLNQVEVPHLRKYSMKGARRNLVTEDGAPGLASDHQVVKPQRITQAFL